MKLSETQSLVWNALSLEWKTGLQIQCEIESNSGQHVGIGALYPILTRFELNGMVEAKMEDASTEEEVAARGGARRRYYRRVPGGLKQVVETRSPQPSTDTSALSPA